MKYFYAFLLVTCLAAIPACSKPNPAESALQSDSVYGAGNSPIGVFVIPNTTTVETSKTLKFEVRVSGVNPYHGVTWQVNGVTGGSAATGTISDDGVYTAPAALPEPAEITVTAVSRDDASKSAAAAVTLTAPHTVAVIVAPAEVFVEIKTKYHFQAQVVNAKDPSVIWQVNGVEGGDAVHGFIDKNGVMTAPIRLPANLMVRVTAVSKADRTKSGSSTVTFRNVNTAHG